MLRKGGAGSSSATSPANQNPFDSGAEKDKAKSEAGNNNDGLEKLKEKIRRLGSHMNSRHWSRAKGAMMVFAVMCFIGVLAVQQEVLKSEEERVQYLEHEILKYNQTREQQENLFKQSETTLHQKLVSLHELAQQSEKVVQEQTHVIKDLEKKVSQLRNAHAEDERTQAKQQERITELEGYKNDMHAKIQNLSKRLLLEDKVGEENIEMMNQFVGGSMFVVVILLVLRQIRKNNLNHQQLYILAKMKYNLVAQMMWTKSRSSPVTTTAASSNNKKTEPPQKTMNNNNKSAAEEDTLAKAKKMAEEAEKKKKKEEEEEEARRKTLLAAEESEQKRKQEAQAKAEAEAAAAAAAAKKSGGWWGKKD